MSSSSSTSTQSLPSLRAFSTLPKSEHALPICLPAVRNGQGSDLHVSGQPKRLTDAPVPLLATLVRFNIRLLPLALLQITLESRPGGGWCIDEGWGGLVRGGENGGGGRGGGGGGGAMRGGGAAAEGEGERLGIFKLGKAHSTDSGRREECEIDLGMGYGPAWAARPLFRQCASKQTNPYQTAPLSAHVTGDDPAWHAHDPAKTCRRSMTNLSLCQVIP
jgi:hypothetical protein